MVEQMLRLGRHWTASLLVLLLAGNGRAGDDLTPGEVFKDCDVCPEMVVIPAGSGEIGTEYPSHRQWTGTVTIPRAFALGRYEVTRREFTRFVEETGYEEGDTCFSNDIRVFSSHSDCADHPDCVTDFVDYENLSWKFPGFNPPDDHPVTCMSSDAANAYVGWLARKTGKNYRLPGDREWEYAARAGTTTAYYWGNQPDPDKANTSGPDGFPGGSGRDRWKYTSPVGSFDPNPFGLHDMSGNVFEWVDYCRCDTADSAPCDGNGQIEHCREQAESYLRGGLRSGSWAEKPALATSGWGVSGDMGEVDFGLRVARDL